MCSFYVSIQKVNIVRAINRLSALAVKNLPAGKHADGGGLWLVKREDGGGKWIYRYAIKGKRREMGLGAIRFVSLKEARSEVDRWRRVVATGTDAIRQRDRQRLEADTAKPTLETVAKACFEARKADLKGGGTAGRWFSPLEIHVMPKIGDVPIEEISQNILKDALAPIWHTKAETARKAMNRLAIVFRHGAAMGLPVDMQATDKAKALLGAQRKKSKHIPSMPWRDVPRFVGSLRNGGIVEQCLIFLILTACRSGEVRAATWDEIDLSANIWVIPAERMKAQKEHRVPLIPEVVEILEHVRPHAREGFVFPSERRGCVSDMAMSMFMRRRDLDSRPHGFRSSFRDWCAEVTDAPREVAEACLAHVTGSEVERAYRRTDFLDRRRELMKQWADHCTGC